MIFLLFVCTRARLLVAFGSGPSTRCSINVPRISGVSSPTDLRAAHISTPPAGVLEPVLMPCTLRLWTLSSSLLLMSGSFSPLMGALGMATTERKTSSFITASASFNWSVAVLTVPASRPLGSVYVVSFIPRSLAAAFIFSTNAASESLPLSQRASSRAALLPDGIISILSMSSWLNFVPAVSPRIRDSFSELPSATAFASIVMSGPGSFLRRGWPLRMT